MTKNEKIDDIYTYSSVGINEVKKDATGENVRKDIDGATAEQPQGNKKQHSDPL